MISNHTQANTCTQGEAFDQPREPLDRLSTIAEEKGWRHALTEVYGPAQTRYATDPARYRFVDILPLGPESKVLEVGSNLGQITCALARKAGFVNGMELSPDTASFAAVRCRQEGLPNVSMRAGGQDCRLPYEDGAFDGVVINLVLEWCAESNAASDHRQMQAAECSKNPHVC